MNKQQRLLFWIAMASLLLAIGAHVYLTDHHYQFHYGQNADGAFCNISEQLNCNHTAASSYSQFMGVPVSIFGALVNFILFLLLLSYRYPLVSKSIQYTLTTSIKLLSFAIFFVSLIMGSISLFIIKGLCPMCAFTYAMSLITFLSVWKLLPDNMGFSMFEVKLFPGIAIFALSFGLLINHNLKKSYGDEDVDEFIQLQFQEWQSKTPAEIKLASPLTEGPKQAKMVMVEFADFLCGHCATAFKPIHDFVKEHPDVQLNFQAFPLDGACNSAIPQSEGTRCVLAQISHCAGQQDKGWQTQEWIFNNQSRLLSKDSVKSLLSEQIPNLGLNGDDLWACVDNPESLEVVRQQAEVGNQLGITGTPSIYINGKKVPGRLSVPLFKKIHRSL
jgi:protein-disulfide isomerase/uncharacterized membrane protein